MHTKFGITNHGQDILREIDLERITISPKWLWLVVALLVIASIQIG